MKTTYCVIENILSREHTRSLGVREETAFRTSKMSRICITERMGLKIFYIKELWGKRSRCHYMHVSES